MSGYTEVQGPEYLSVQGNLVENCHIKGTYMGGPGNCHIKGTYRGDLETVTLRGRTGGTWKLSH